MHVIIYIHVLLFCLEKSYANEIGISPEIGTDGRMRSLRNLCPYNKFCGSNPLKEIESPDHEPCCEECSCENDCFETGSCCPDMPLSGFAEPRFACRHLWDFGNLATDILRPKSSVYWYHIIDDCPERVKAVSYEKCFKPTEVRDYAIVLDTSTGKLYRNKHCAECNSIMKYVQLQLRVHCNDIHYKYMYSLTTTAEREKYILKNCSLTSLPPDMRIGLSHCLPENKVISACNFTGEWDIYNYNIEKSCMIRSNDQNMIFRAPATKERVFNYYANVFCFLCNVPSASKMTESCEIIPPHDYEKSRIISLYAILDLKMWGDDDEVVTKETTCSATQIWDPFSKSCRKLFCPNGLVPIHGSCKGYFNNIYGYNIASHFKVYFENGTFALDLTLINILKDRINRELGNDISCGMCRAALLTGNNSTSQLFYRQEVYTRKECPYDTLLKRLRKLAIKKKLSVKFRYRSQVIRIVLIFIFDEINYNTGYKLLIESFISFCPPAKVIDTSIYLYCPTIDVSNHVVNELGLNSFSTTSSSISPHANNSESILQHVCVNNYFSAKRSNSAPANTLTLYHTSTWIWFVLTQIMQ